MLKHWKTTLAGVALLLNLTVSVVNDPTKIMDTQNATTLMAAIGLIMGADAKKQQ